MTREELARLAPGDCVSVTPLYCTERDARRESACVIHSIKPAGAFVSPGIALLHGREEFFLARELERR
jgi:hypothetical protein